MWCCPPIVSVLAPKRHAVTCRVPISANSFDVSLCNQSLDLHQMVCNPRRLLLLARSARFKAAAIDGMSVSHFV